MLSAAQMEIEEVLNNFAEFMSGLMIDRHQRHVAELELTLPQVQALRVLRRGPVPTGQLAAELGCSAPAITQLTDRLIRKGLIERRTAESDRRTVLIALSAKGTSVVDEFRHRRSRIFCEALGRFSDKEQAEIIKALKMVTTALEDCETEAITKREQEISIEEASYTRGTKEL
jgi:DNA-binding MarR family transcriptional regulator